MWGGWCGGNSPIPDTTGVHVACGWPSCARRIRGAELKPAVAVPYARISVQLKRAVVAAEDAKFIRARGLRLGRACRRRWRKNQKKGKRRCRRFDHLPTAGQESFSSPAAKTPWRKVQEAIITV
jgi:membrane carboxypeptidase/penicillin-binding protein